MDFSSSSWLSLSFLILDSKVGSVKRHFKSKVCVGFWCDFLLILTALSLVGGQSVYAVGLSSPLSKSSFILFILGVFRTPKSR